MRIFFPEWVRIKAEVRKRLFLWSGDLQTAHLHPKMGTPVLVPEPKIVILFIKRMLL